jgi:ATP synthase protein I
VRLTDGRRNGGDDLDRRIASAKGQLDRASSASARSESRGWAIGIEFVGAILVSGLIGWAIDHYVLNSAPWAMILMLVLGFAAGVRRAMKTTAQFDADLTNNDPR